MRQFRYGLAGTPGRRARVAKAALQPEEHIGDGGRVRRLCDMRSQDTITLSPFTEVDTPAGEVTIPRELGSVRLLREIGRGGMGVVYLARHQMLDRDVAVKFLLNAVAGPDDAGLARLLEGARAAARLEHPGLTTIHHADVVQGVPYLVMQYVDGPALNDVLKRSGPLSLPALFAVLDAILQAIGALHERDIVHGDIKPANILLDRKGQVFVTDFGLSCFRPLGRRGEPSAGLAGTPAYMAPEMFDGTVSPRSDVYALGITAFELLAGELPFTGTLEELRQKHLHEPLPLDLLRRRQVDPALIEVLERATHKNAMFRYKTAEHFRNALKAGITTDELLRQGAADLQKLGTRSVDKEPDVATTEAASHTPTSSYFDRLSAMADEKRVVRELRDKEDAPKPTQDHRAQTGPIPDVRPVASEPGGSLGTARSVTDVHFPGRSTREYRLIILYCVLGFVVWLSVKYELARNFRDTWAGEGVSFICGGAIVALALLCTEI